MMTSAEDVRLTEQEIDQARLAFLKFDTDGSGSIDQVRFRLSSSFFCFCFCKDIDTFSFFFAVRTESRSRTYECQSYGQRYFSDDS